MKNTYQNLVLRKANIEETIKRLSENLPLKGDVEDCKAIVENLEEDANKIEESRQHIERVLNNNDFKGVSNPQKSLVNLVTELLQAAHPYKELVDKYDRLTSRIENLKVDLLIVDKKLELAQASVDQAPLIFSERIIDAIEGLDIDLEKFIDKVLKNG